MRAAFIAPVCFIIVVNFCIMAAVIRIVVKSSATANLKQKKKVRLVK